MRRWIAAAAVCSLPLALSGCAALMDTSSGAPASAITGPITVLAGNYPLAFAAERIGGEHVKVTNLSGSSSGHDYEVSPKDIAALNQAHSILYSKGYVPGLDDAIKQMGPRPSILNAATWADLMTEAKGGLDAHDHGKEEPGKDDHDHGKETPAKPKPSTSTSKPKPSKDDHDHDHEKVAPAKPQPSRSTQRTSNEADTVIIIPAAYRAAPAPAPAAVPVAAAPSALAAPAVPAIVPAAAGASLPAQDDDKHDHHAGDGHDHGGVDPHFWLDPVRYSTVAFTIAQHFTQLAPQHRDAFSANAASFVGELKKIRSEYQTGLRKCTSRTIVTSHTAFGYLANAYGLTQVGIAGIDPEKEPSPAVMSKIAAFAKEKKIKSVYTESAVNPALAETVAKEAGATIAHLEPIESASAVPAGKTIFDVMRSNLAALKKGQGCS